MGRRGDVPGASPMTSSERGPQAAAPCSARHTSSGTSRCAASSGDKSSLRQCFFVAASSGAWPSGYGVPRRGALRRAAHERRLLLARGLKPATVLPAASPLDVQSLRPHLPAHKPPLVASSGARSPQRHSQGASGWRRSSDPHASALAAPFWLPPWARWAAQPSSWTRNSPRPFLL